MVKLPSRQVHLDFHTSELIADVGRDFDPARFQAAVKAGHLNSITVFAKCHHSWSYYPTEVGRPHPTLQCDLMGGQIEACHAIGVRAPIYFTVGWSATDAETHPEWTVRKEDGSIAVTNFDLNAGPETPKPICSWKFLCPSGDYLKLMLAQTAEICERYPVDGFFYDICFGPGCTCDNCRAGMEERGLNPASAEDAAKYRVIKWQHFMTECNAVIQEKHPEATIFYNGGASQYSPEWHDWMTHFELEDLPTTWGGYDKFPIRARYFANKGKDYLAMSGKFHTMWGEFGGFKHPDAIRFEAACMIAYGSRCSFGDQLHPLGDMDPETYRNIGIAYEYVEQIEEYGLDGVCPANLGVWLSGSNADDQGVANMLLETQTEFVVVDPAEDLSRFETILLPGAAFLDEATAERLNAYTKAGGSLLVLGEAALDKAKTRFILDVGAGYVGPARHVNDYLVVGPVLAEEMVTTPFLNYSGALRARLEDAEALASIREPYFDRTYGHYCSHQNTPNRLEAAEHPGAWRKGNVVVLAHRLGEMYGAHGARLHRQLFLNALRLVHKKPVITAPLPSGGRVTLVHQPEKRRYVAHLMYGPPMQRGRCMVIEDLVPLYDTPITLRVPEQVTAVSLVPSGEALALKSADGEASTVVPKFAGHQAVVFQY